MLRNGRDKRKNETDYDNRNNFSIMEKRHYDKWNAYECAEKEIDKNTHN
jgi:hypothetical protein